MYELETLRSQVQDEDLDQFDIKTLSLRKIIINLINGYTGECQGYIIQKRLPMQTLNNENFHYCFFCSVKISGRTSNLTFKLIDNML